jgi:hypothetical protein
VSWYDQEEVKKAIMRMYRTMRTIYWTMATISVLFTLGTAALLGQCIHDRDLTCGILEAFILGLLSKNLLSIIKTGPPPRPRFE